MHTSELTVRDLGEKRLLREVIKPLLPSVPDGVGVGDDAAVLPFPHGRRLVVSSDKIPENLLALEFGLMTPREHGRYLVAVSVSDIVAMGAAPLGVLLTFALTDDFSVDYLREFVIGAVAAGGEWGAPILGGDTGSASVTCLSSAAVGHAGAHLLTRAGAKKGNVLALSGPVGAFGAALAYFSARARGTAPTISPELASGLQNRLVRPTPRVDLGPLLADGDWCTSCIDVTDGLSQSIRELSEASGRGFDVMGDLVPIHPLARELSEAMNIDPYELAFGIGLELELLVTLDIKGVDHAQKFGVIPFGSVRGDAITRFYRNGREEASDLPGKGWEHFGGEVRDFIARAP